MAYNYQGAISAGAKPTDVINYLANQTGYNATAALQAGANPQDVLKYMSNLPNKTVAKEPSTLDKVESGIESVFPGKQVGQAIGTLGGLGVAKAKDFLTGSHTAENYDTSAPSPLQVAGDIGQGALTIAAPEIGNEGSALSKIGANTALGAGMGATQSISEGGNGSDVAKSAIGGAATGGVVSGLAEGAGKLIDQLPTWLTKKALPKLNSANVDYALENTKLGSVKSMLSDSKKATQSYESQIQSILNHPQYATETGSPSIIDDIIKKNPNAELNQNKVTSILKQVAPNNKTLIDKVADGEATLFEKNTLRKELDVATAKAYTDKPNMTFAKNIGKDVADALRHDVQMTAPETQDIFKNYAKEINLKQALTTAQKKIDNKGVIGLFDILSTIGGGIAGGIPAAAGFLGAEKALRSPAVDIGAAKALKGIGKVSPIGNDLVQGSKALLEKAITKKK